jgi:hypothetical protein
METSPYRAPGPQPPHRDRGTSGFFVILLLVLIILIAAYMRRGNP